MKKLLEDFEAIKDCEDLKERNLSLSDYKALGLIIEDLKKEKKSCFFQTTIAKYLIKQGIKIDLKSIYFVAKV